MDDLAVDDTVQAVCGCDHRQSAHGPDGKCTQGRMVTDYAALPTPTYDGPVDPLAYPNNWPPALLVPKTEIPCGCPGFHVPEPDEHTEEP